MWQYTDDSPFPEKKEKRPEKTRRITWLNALLLGTCVSSLASGCSPTIEETRKCFRTDILLLCFVIQYPYQITLCVYRLRKPTACLSPDISGYNLTDVARSEGGLGSGRSRPPEGRAAKTLRIWSIPQTCQSSSECRWPTSSHLSCLSTIL